MVPDSFTTYFAAATGAAAALIGLLFVSVTLRPETVFGSDAPQRGRALAATSFTGLVNSFFLSLAALVPGSNLGIPALTLAVVGSVAIARLHLQLSRNKRQLVLLVLGLISFIFQGVVGAALVAHAHDRWAVTDLAWAMIGSLAVSLARAWTLLQGKHIEAAAPRGGAPLAAAEPSSRG